MRHPDARSHSRDCADATPAQSETFNAYYYSFTATGQPQIDAVLKAVARAGKAYHHTERWSDGDDGQSEADKIQAAANEAAKQLSAPSPTPEGLTPDALSLIEQLERELADAAKQHTLRGSDATSHGDAMYCAGQGEGIAWAATRLYALLLRLRATPPPSGPATEVSR